MTEQKITCQQCKYHLEEDFESEEDEKGNPIPDIHWACELPVNVYISDVMDTERNRDIDTDYQQEILRSKGGINCEGFHALE